MHCTVHRLNLVLVDSVKSVKAAGDFFCILESLYVFIATSKAHEIFIAQHKKIMPNEPPKELKRLSDTHWSCKYSAILAVQRTYPSIVATLDVIIKGEDRKKAVEAQGITNQISQLQFIIGLVVFGAIFGLTNKLSVLLQSPHLDLAAAVQLIQAQISILQEYRCNEKWDLLWTETEAIARSLNVNTENISRMDRRSQLPCRLQVDSVVFTSVGARTKVRFR